MDDITRRNAARQEMVELLLVAVEQAHELATKRLPRSPQAIKRHYLKLEGLGRDTASLSTALRILEAWRNA